MTSPPNASVAAAVPSPCTSVCTMDAATGLCAGCFRTLDEIAAWSVLDDDEKRAVWSALAHRRAANATSAASATLSRTGANGQR
jgi:uncharacterized protein